MTVIQILKKEHYLILQTVDLLARSRDYLEKGVIVSSEFYEKAMRFCHDFADRFHHYKEEFLLFGLLAHKKEGRLDAVMGTLRYQHERCSQCVTEIENVLKTDRKYDEMTVTFLLENLSVYVSLLRRHIYLENTVFFPMADRSLTDEEKDSLSDQFAAEEARLDLQGSVSEENRKIIIELEDILTKGKSDD
ncbi:MAG: hemerythrin domain-containing protein [Desulfarculaceae bacterium]|nr:hemerythrin domain-containing protein [Desulfarculaceae bacterium]